MTAEVGFGVLREDLDSQTGLPFLRLTCGEVRGGNEPIHAPVALPGLRGVLYSTPCGGTRGGDVHYLSVCGSGLLSRVCVADVAGHGETVAVVSSLMHGHLRRSVDIVDERRVFRVLDRRLGALGTRAMTTAALVTYYPPSRRLTVSYAGHPPGWLFRAREGAWQRLNVTDGDAGVLTGLPLGTGLDTQYSRRRLTAEPGDRLVLVTDGVTEAPRTADDEQFGTARIERALERGRGLDCRGLAESILADVHAFCGHARLEHDDVTIFVGEIVPGPPGPALWHVLRNRLLRRRPAVV